MRSIQKIAILCLLIAGEPGFSQNNIEGFIGYNKTDISIVNCYSDCGSITGSNNLTFGFAIENIKIDWLNLRFTLRYDSFNAGIDTENGGLGGGNTIEADIRKSILSLGVFPINFKLFKALDISIGFEVSQRIYEDFSGTAGFWSIGEYSDTGMTSESWDVNDRYDHMSARNTFGIRSRIAYDIHINDELYISPQIGLYVGLSNELENVLVENRAMRSYASIGVGRRF